MFKEKTKPTLSPAVILSQLAREAVDKHRYERLEWEVSYPCMRYFYALEKFITLCRLDEGLGTHAMHPPAIHGVFYGMTVYLDRELPDGVVDIRTVEGETVATVNFSRESEGVR